MHAGIEIISSFLPEIKDIRMAGPRTKAYRKAALEALIRRSKHYLASGRVREAIVTLTLALAENPSDTRILFALADACRRDGNFIQAADCLQRITELEPGSFPAWCNLGAALWTLKRASEAAIVFEKALSLNPESAEVHNNLGMLHSQAGKHTKAIAHFQAAIKLGPSVPHIHNNLGNALCAAKDLAGAQKAFEAALDLDPDHLDALNNLGNLFAGRGDFEQAKSCFLQAIRAKQDCADAHYNLGNLLRESFNIDEAISCFINAIQANPQSAAAMTNLAESLQVLGDLDTAEEWLHKALFLDDASDTIWGLLLSCMQYNPVYSTREIFQEHAQWGTRFAGKRTIMPYHNTINPRRRLTIGYVSPDFCGHPAGAFLEPLLANHDSSAFEIICYSNTVKEDAATSRFKSCAKLFHNISNLSDDEAEKLVRGDSVDLLVDCAGHTFGNRLALMARKPAPVQITFLGYPGTTGLSAIDYRLTDAIADPEGEEHFYAETLVRIQGGFSCWKPPAIAPEISPLPAAARGAVTFGSLHTLARLNPVTIALWSEVIKAVPGSQLLIFRTTLTPIARERLSWLFAENGVDTKRIIMTSAVPPKGGHLAVYDAIDIALDTFPWSGHTTACEALYMGVPMVTLAGNRHAGRMVASVLTQIQKAAWIARSREDFITIARRLASDITALKEIRRNLRAQATGSRLCDGAAYARAVEEQYRLMWRNWCDQHSAA